LRSFDRTRDDRSARRFAFAAIESFDGDIEEFVESIPTHRRSSAFSASTASSRAVSRSTSERSSTTSAARSS
jgi:hypothetical protein